jgi:hypothetical protein
MHSKYSCWGWDAGCGKLLMQVTTTSHRVNDAMSVDRGNHCYVSFAQFATECVRQRNASFSAKWRLVHRSKRHPYSITSSARPRSGSGTVMPSALAVLRLMINSTFVVCWTGISAGFAPLRIRPV